MKRSIRAPKKWKCLVNLLFTKSWIRSEHHTWHHFLRMNCNRWCQQTQFSSTAGFNNKMKLKLRLLPFSVHCIHTVNACFGFSFVVFYLWVNSDNVIHWQTRHTGLLQIPCFGSCPLSINWKILLICLVKYVISGQSKKETDHLDLYVFIWIQFQINHFHFLEKYKCKFYSQTGCYTL